MEVEKLFYLAGVALLGGHVVVMGNFDPSTNYSYLFELVYIGTHIPVTIVYGI